jgi:Fur family transcriptional regulator, ferric uptake regulator
MSDIAQLLGEELRKNGYSMTKARQLVFKALENQEPLSMNELVKAVEDKIDRASAYRTVALFEKLGIVQRLQIGWKYKLELSDRFNYHHHHVSCTNCGMVAPLREDSLLETSLQNLAREYGFTPQSHQIEIQGLCARCRSLET